MTAGWQWEILNMVHSRRSSFPSWLPMAVILGVLGLALYAYTGQARRDLAGAS